MIGIQNPEFRRNVWHELTPHRLLLTPLILAAIFFLVYLFNGNSNRVFATQLSQTSFVIFALFAFLFGTKLATNAVHEELRDHTWDFQRMSAISAWSMSWGKLAGSTCYAWYGALIALAAYVTSMLYLENIDLVARITVLYLASAIFAQASGLLISLDSLQKTRDPGKGGVVIALLFGFSVMMAARRLAALWQKTSVPSLDWYNYSINIADFTCVSILIFLCWSVYGVYRYMRIELQYQSTPIAWLSFVAFMMVYLAGFIPANTIYTFGTRLIVAFLIGTTAVYLTALREPKNPVLYRRLADRIRTGSFSVALRGLPRWLMVLPVTGVLAFAIPFTTAEVFEFRSLSIYPTAVPALFCFMLRDIAILLFLNFGAGGTKRSDTAFLIYIALLYILFPLIVTAGGLKELLFIFIPTFTESIFKAILPPLLQFLLVAILLRSRWLKSRSRLEAS